MSNTKPLPNFFVGKKISNDRKNQFMARQYPELCKLLGHEDTRSIWYSRDHLATLLDEIDHAKGDGLRIYLAAYETGEYQGQTCLIMNVTRINPQGRRVDVHLEDEPDYQDRLNASPITTGTGERDFTLPANKPETIKDFNFGSPCPPRCD